MPPPSSGLVGDEVAFKLTKWIEEKSKNPAKKFINPNTLPPSPGLVGGEVEEEVDADEEE